MSASGVPTPQQISQTRQELGTVLKSKTYCGGTLGEARTDNNIINNSAKTAAKRLLEDVRCEKLMRAPAAKIYPKSRQLFITNSFALG